jgi:hypothetical protein
MITPYDGKVSLWHWKGQAVVESTIEALIASIKQQAPNTDAIFVKTSDADEWQGNFDNKASMRIAGPADITRWVNTLASAGVDFHAWCVVRGADVDGESARIIEAAQVPGVRSIILDVEPYEQYWKGTRDDVIRLMTRVRSAVGNDLHIGLSIDPRKRWYSAIYPDAWRPYVDSLHPQCYWQTMGRTPENILTETYDTWGGYGLPIYPVLQGAASTESVQQAQDIARSVRGATGLSYWRIGVISAAAYTTLNDKKVDAEVGPDGVWRRYGWEKIVAPCEAGYADGTHTGEAPSSVFDELIGVRGDSNKYKMARSDSDTVWAMWRPDLPVRGTYEVSVFIPGVHATTHQARYHIHGVIGVGSEVLVRLDQSRYHNQWVPLVVLEFGQSPEGAQVNLTDLTGETDKEIAFTAIRWRQVLEQRET